MQKPEAEIQKAIARYYDVHAKSWVVESRKIEARILKIYGRNQKLEVDEKELVAWETENQKPEAEK